ncbi:sigma-54-dependent Fis family transcriptional regulator [Clostridium sp. MSJ-4]|uniref:Sigma-54-dependent Fis family transcriptional regulator n=1 Tax=Clostridium simiarum TaxID=2841506 RepID=A0ABS6F2L9_9CLOT|nr:sigma-54-dependent Fis family transcriptional regulator [Clostridium simiarum]MBU5592541.1 sigma-54-dependent Fis family transcriptional regulator [Clostridium simiarum]
MYLYQRIKSAYNSFINNNIIEDYIREDIALSWKRCRELGVNPLGGMGRKIPSSKMKDKLEENSELLFVAKPIMENMYNIVAGSGFSIILTDKDGCLLEVLGDESIMEKSYQLNFIKGTLWSEAEVGTNAIGTCLYLDKPIQTMGAEHYCVKQHDWSCSATTIHDDKGNIIGCLNMSGSYEGAHPHTLGMVLTGAYSIEKQLALIKSNKLINATFQSISDGMIIISKDFKILNLNHKAAETLGYEKEELINMNIKDIIRDVSFIDKMLNHSSTYNNFDCDFYDKNNNIIKCTMNAVPICNYTSHSNILITFRTSQAVNKLVNQVIGFSATYRFQDILTVSKSMKKTIEYAKKAALSQCNVLIQGPSGTGKELFAQSIHNYSQRSKEPFVAVNCASIPKELIESELFGYEKGAFTGASKEGHVGKFELADGGTIFLDEIGEMPLDMQSKLLRVLDNKKICRVGGNYEKKLNIRIIAATNRDLLGEIKKKSFREDLYYRLNVMSIKLLPLSERPEDIEILSKHFIKRLNKEQFNEKLPSPNYIESLKNHIWSGNVRELQNVVERSYYLCEDNIITEKYIVVDESSNIKKEITNPKTLLSLEEVEKNIIINTLKDSNLNMELSCKILKLSRATLYRRMKKYGISLKEIKAKS